MNQPIPAAPDLDTNAMEAARRRWDGRAKPPGALGRIEDLAVHLAGVTGRCPPPIPANPAIIVFAGDHGVVEDGASAWPSEITAAMVQTIGNGGAAINAFAQTIGATVTVVDVGVKSPLDCLPNVKDERIRNGTASLAQGPAMSRAEALAAVNVGSTMASESIDGGADCLIGGEMGIGNTTASAALISVLTNSPAKSVTGPGAGLPTEGLDHKKALIVAAIERASGWADPVELLAEIGGLEIASLAGLYITAARRRTPYILDGVIACAALCVAEEIAPGTATHAVAGHRSTEPAANAALSHLGLDPLLELDMRLGEGTGAALAFPLLQAATTALIQMADLPQ